MQYPYRLRHTVKKETREIRYFFFSQYFADGLRITLAILLPSLILAQFGHFDIGLAMSLGAVCVSIADSPGPVLYKRNGMLLCNLLVFLVALVTGYARMNMFTLGLEIAVFSFFFSMFTVYGVRASSVGTAAILIMILMIEKALKPAEIPVYCLMLLAGGVWYMSVSMLFFGLRPYRQAQRALGECMRETARYLRVKADFYDLSTDLDDNYKDLMAAQVAVSEKQDSVRELLFKTRVIVKESTNTSRKLMLSFIDLVDLYEHMTSIYYDYHILRERYGNTGVLGGIARYIRLLAHELDEMGYDLITHGHFHRNPKLNEQLEKLGLAFEKVVESSETSSLVLKKLYINLRNLTQRINDIFTCLSSSPETPPGKLQDIEHSRFVPRQSYNIKLFFDNFSLNSASFKHALRVMLACIVGFMTAKFIALGHHSYWILLTIIVILKPGFSLTKQRNFQRLLGTFLGGLIGVLVILFVQDKIVLFCLLLVFMLGSYTFQRLNYIVMVILVTPYVIILFKMLGLGTLGLVEERVLDTAIGSVIAFIASYVIFPNWESKSIRSTMRNVLRANAVYMEKLLENLAGKKLSIEEYKLARKDVYVSSANLAAAFQRMLSDPKSKQRNIKEIHRFVVLNHILSSNIATLNSAMLAREQLPYSNENFRLLRRAFGFLNESLKKLDPQHKYVVSEASITKPAATESVADSQLLKEQLEFIQKVSNDICKITDEVMA